MPARFCRISCICEGKKSRRGRSTYLGDIQVDIPNTARHFCKNCGTLWSHTIDAEGTVIRSKVKDKIQYFDEIVILSPATPVKGG